MKKISVLIQTERIFKGLQVYSQNFQVGKADYTFYMRTMFVACLVRSQEVKGRSGKAAHLLV